MTALHWSMLMRVTEIHLLRFMILSAVTWRRIQVRVFPSPPAWDLFPNTCMESGTGFEGLPLQLGEVPADLSWPPSGNMGSQKIPLKPGLWGFSSHLLREGTRGSLSIRVASFSSMSWGGDNKISFHWLHEWQWEWRWMGTDSDTRSGSYFVG